MKKTPGQNQNPILVVDDNGDILTMVAAQINSIGIPTVTAKCGSDAFALLEANFKKYGEPRIKAVISDWNMPNGDGLNLVKNIRASTYGNIPFVLMSATATIDDLLKVDEGAIDVFLPKPFLIQDLLKALEQAGKKRSPK